MIEMLNSNFLTRFSALPAEVQSRIIAATDAGAALSTTCSLTDGAYRCVLAGYTQEILFEEALTEPDAAIIGEGVCEILDSQPAAAHSQLAEALKNGALILIAVDHVSGNAGIHIAHSGQIVCLAKLDAAAPVWKH